jgi:L-asparaginase
MNPEPIRVLVTGGTLDKEYNEMKGSLFLKKQISKMLRLGRSRIDVSISTLMMIDSLEMTAADRTDRRRVQVRLSAIDLPR